MTAPLYEETKNSASTTLNGAIDASTTTVVVTDGSVFPTSGNFRILIDSEIMLCTAISTNTLTVVRGSESTTGASHSNGADVYHIATAGALERLALDGWPAFGYGRPMGIYANDGASRLVASDFTAVNQEVATISDSNGTLLLLCPPASGTDLRIFARTAPSTPYAYIAAFQVCLAAGHSDDEAQHFGVGFRESSSGKFIVMMYVNQSHGIGSNPAPHRLQVRQWAGPDSATYTTIRSELTLVFAGPLVWMRVEDDGTNLIYSIGPDGQNWIQIHSVDRDTYMTTGPDQVLWYGQNSGFSTDAFFRLCHWSQE